MLSYNDLNDYQKELLIVNGCGGKGSIIKPPYKIFFNASCNYHDATYLQGGTENDRMKADYGFLKALKSDCEKIKNPIVKTWYLIWCYIYYYAVRSQGYQFFRYRLVKLSLEELLYRIENNLTF